MGSGLMGIVVVKCGGAVPAEAVCADLAGLAGRVVLVHGGAADVEIGRASCRERV